MTDQQRKAFARHIRRYAQLIADHTALTSLLDSYEEEGRPPEQWKKMLAEIRNSDTYRAILEEFEPLITSLESSSDDAGLIELLPEISEGKLPS
jgi:hypothetical protein